MEHLNAHTLARLDARHSPKLAPLSLLPLLRPAAQPSVVHLGLGAFHRAHQAMVFDALLRGGDPRWAVLGVAMRSTQVADTLARQDGLYSVQVASSGQTCWQVVGSVRQTCVAAREPATVIATIAAPATRWITLTVTEKGYTAELAALMAQGLALRQAAGLPGLTIASCDNLGSNGDKLKSLCLQAAAQTQLRQWIEAHCAFPNSMVDRIVPASTARCREDAQAVLQLVDDAALATEEFWDWVIEDCFADPADADVLRSVGVKVVESVKPFEIAKLRMLNGSHSAMACMGAVLGLPTIHDCISRPELRRFVHGLMTDEIMPGLARPDTAAYRDALLERFGNQSLNHSVHQIATDSSMKIPQRWLPPVLAQLDAGGSVEHLALATAVWMRYCLGEDEQGHTYAMSDPLAPALQAIAQQHRGDVPEMVGALLAISAIWGNALPHDVRWKTRVAYWLQAIKRQGVAATLMQLHPAD